jgi:hypothetical protein
MMRIDPEKLNISLPPEQFQAATTDALPPVISATYSSKQWEDMIRSRQHQFGVNLERVNRAAMSGSKRLTDEMVQKSNSFATAYAERVTKAHPIQSAEPLIGSGRSTSLKMATEKKMMGE